MCLRKTLTSLVVVTIVLGLGTSAFTKTISGEVRWSGQMKLTESVVVEPQAKLTVAAGTQVFAENEQVKISVRGVIEVAGTEAAPVVFKGKQGWLGIEFMEAPHNSTVRWAEIYNSEAALSSFATNFKVENSTFKDNSFAIKLLRESSPVVHDSTFVDNKVGISNEMKSGPEIRGNRFSGHTQAAILASHNSVGIIADNVFEKNKQGVALLQKYTDRVIGNKFIENEVGVYCNQTQSTPLIEDNLFEGNQYGVLNFSFAYPAIKNNKFIDNKTAVHNDQYGSPLLENNLLKGNETALYNYRKSNPKVRRNLFEKNGLALYCDFSSYPEVKDNNFINNATGVELGIYQSADWEKRSGSKKIMQREALSRQSQNPLLAQAPDSFNDFVDVSGNWWGEDTKSLKTIGENENSPLFYDRHDKPKVTYPDYGPGEYRLDIVRFVPWLEKPVADAGTLEKK